MVGVRGAPTVRQFLTVETIMTSLFTTMLPRIAAFFRPANPPSEPSLARQKVLDIAHRCQGLGAPMAEFERMLGPAPKGGWDLDRPFKCWKDESGHWHTEGVSTCALFACQVLVDAGVLPSRPSPYAPGTIEALLTTQARNKGLWRTTGTPKPGDVVNVASPSHWLIVTGVKEGRLESVDAGQVGTDGLQCIRACSRPFTGGAIGGRRVVGFVDVE